MTDNEIIRALECCISDGYTCVECPYADTKHIIGDEYELMPNGKTYDEFSCDEWLKLDLFAIINRQKAEIEKLKVSTIICEYRDLLIENAKLVRINWENELVEGVKAEAIKEFAERLILVEETTAINCATNEKVVRVSDIDNLVKEMTEEKK